MVEISIGRNQVKNNSKRDQSEENNKSRQMSKEKWTDLQI